MLSVKKHWNEVTSQVIGLDPSHPLRNNIKFAMFPGQFRSGGNHLDLNSTSFFPRVDNGTTNSGFGNDVNGSFFDFDAPNDSSWCEIELGQPQELEITDEITILSGYVRTGNQNTGFGRIISRTNGGTGDDWSTTINAESGGSAVRWRVQGDSLTGATSLVLNQYYDIANVFKSGDRYIALDGKIDASDTLVDTLSTDQDISIGANPSSDGGRALTGKLYYVIVLDRALSIDEVRDFNKNPYQILAPQTRYVAQTSVVSSGNNAVISINEADDTVSISAAVDNSRSASIAITESGDTVSISASVDNSRTASIGINEADDVVLINAAVGSVNNAVISINEQDDVVLINAEVINPVDATIAIIETGDTVLINASHPGGSNLSDIILTDITLDYTLTDIATAYVLTDISPTYNLEAI